jgi:hypothetical protein
MRRQFEMRQCLNYLKNSIMKYSFTENIEQILKQKFGENAEAIKETLFFF